MVRLADQLLEFDMEINQGRLEPRLLASVEKLPDSVRALDQAAVQALTTLCSTFGARVADGVSHEDLSPDESWRARAGERGADA
ncbi:hypothetical protein D3C84_819030 [compost metagenome]